MSMNTECLESNGECMIAALQDAQEKLDSAGTELVLDFSSVRQIDPGTLRALEQLAGMADEKAVKLVLRGINVDVYKVLKLVKLAPRFTFLG
jgi:anti-anti-sigma regulatory factor